jgi:hypothetical protein
MYLRILRVPLLLRSGCQNLKRQKNINSDVLAVLCCYPIKMQIWGLWPYQIQLLSALKLAANQKFGLQTLSPRTK